MYSKLFDNETMSRVIAAAPVVATPSALTASQVLVVLQKETMETTNAKMRANLGADRSYFFMPVQAIANALGDGVTPKAVGSIIHQMGLQVYRRTEGYYVAWNEKQIEIIAEALA